MGYMILLPKEYLRRIIDTWRASIYVDIPSII